MLISLHHKLAFLATPKTGTTAVEMALRPKCEIVFKNNRKHITALRYHMRVGPFVHQTFGVRPDTLAVMRHPVDQIKSWYRYRGTERLGASLLSTEGMDFDAFVLAVIADDPPPTARIGSQFKFLTSDHGDLLVQHLFAYENQPAFRRFLSERFETRIAPKAKNVSPRADTPLSPDVEAQLRAARADEFALYDRLQAAGGYLHTPPA